MDGAVTRCASSLPVLLSGSQQVGLQGDRQAETTVSAAWSAALLPLAPYPWKAELVREESLCYSMC